MFRKHQGDPCHGTQVGKGELKEMRSDLGFTDTDYIFYFFWLHHMAFEILVPPLLLEPVPPAVEAQNPNHWTAREVP